MPFISMGWTSPLKGWTELLYYKAEPYIVNILSYMWSSVAKGTIEAMPPPEEDMRYYMKMPLGIALLSECGKMYCTETQRVTPMSMCPELLTSLINRGMGCQSIR